MFADLASIDRTAAELPSSNACAAQSLKVLEVERHFRLL
jgi:hypothetical protein